jgi:hypothetical protein
MLDEYNNMMKFNHKNIIKAKEILFEGKRCPPIGFSEKYL